MDKGFGRGVAFDEVPFEEFGAVAGQRHEVISLDLEEGRQKGEMVEVCYLLALCR